MRSYGDIEVIRSGAVAMSLEAKKLRLQPPVATPAGPRDANGASPTRARPDEARASGGDAGIGREEDTEVEVSEES
jgi:hypothetical protein